MFKDYKLVKQFDPELAKAYNAELKRQRQNLELIASENIVSPAVMAAMGSWLTNKYAEGYPGKRYYGGCEHVDVVEAIAIERAKKLFNAGFANVQTHSGANANLAAFFALGEPGDTVLGMNLAHGGHLSHGSPVNVSGKWFNVVSYGVERGTGYINYNDVLEIAKQFRPKIIIAGASAYPRAIEFDRFQKIAREVGAYLVVDMAHIAGLIAAGLHQNPVPYADVVTSTTHKTLRGPRGGLILTNNADLAVKIDKAVFPGTQGGPLMHVIGAKAVAFLEALKPEFTAYQKQVVQNAKALADGLTQRGISLVSGGTDTHKMLVSLIGTGLTGKELEKLLDKARITCNKNGIPFDPEKPFVTSGVRLGTPAVTTRGMKQGEMAIIANCIADIVEKRAAAVQDVKKTVDGLCKAFPLY